MSASTSSTDQVCAFRAGDRLPVTLSKRQLAGILGVSVWTLDMLRRERSHPAIKELLPRTGHPRFCGVAAQAWLDQRAAAPVVHSFGRKRA